MAFVWGNHLLPQARPIFPELAYIFPHVPLNDACTLPVSSFQVILT